MSRNSVLGWIEEQFVRVHPGEYVRESIREYSSEEVEFEGVKEMYSWVSSA